MKKINKFLIGIFGITILLLSSCTEDIVREPSPIQEGGIQAFIYENTATSMAFLPANDQSFNVIIGRKSSDAATLNLSITDASDVFTLPESITFAAGQLTDTVKVTFNMELGKTANLIIKLANTDSYIYARDSINITVSRDYTWISAGTVSMKSDWAGVTKDIALQKAKETVGLYRIMSPYYVLEPDYCPNPGFHLQFELDADYNAVSIPAFQNIGEAASSGGSYWLYWNSSKSYCTFSNVGNVYTIEGAWAKGLTTDALTLVAYATEIFTWTEGYPGK